MTKGTPDELRKYNLPTLAEQLMSGSFTPVNVSLTPREIYAWMLIGGVDKVREMIAPTGTCTHCAEEKTWDDSYQGWFCYACNRNLGRLGLLGLPHIR